jgi:uncharacterized protein YoxC
MITSVDQLIRRTFSTDEEYLIWVKREIQRELTQDEYLLNIQKLNKINQDVQQEVDTIGQITDNLERLDPSKSDNINIWQRITELRQKIIKLYQIQDVISKLIIEEHNNWFKSEYDEYNELE